MPLCFNKAIPYGQQITKTNLLIGFGYLLTLRPILMVTQNENENEIHFGNFLLKNKTKSVLVIRTENQKRIRFRFRFG